MEGQRTLSSLYCAKFKCSPGEFEKKVFWQCVYPLATPVAWFLWLVNRDFFSADLDLIREIKHAGSYTEVKNVLGFASMQKRRRNYLRIFLNIRLSKRRLQNLARELFSPPDK